MAAATLTLNAPLQVTLEATPTNLRELILPEGCRWLEYTSSAAWYWQVDDGVLVDGAAGTATAQMMISAGTASLRVPGSGRGNLLLQEGKSIFLAGSTASQVIYLRATSDGV